MSWHDLVSAQTSNVCITRHAALSAIAHIVCVKQFVMSISLGDWFSGSRKGGTGEEVGCYIHPKGKNSMAVCGGHCTNGPENSLLTSQGLHAVFKCDSLARAG